MISFSLIFYLTAYTLVFIFLFIHSQTLMEAYCIILPWYFNLNISYLFYCSGQTRFIFHYIWFFDLSFILWFVFHSLICLWFSFTILYYQVCASAQLEFLFSAYHVVCIIIDSSFSSNLTFWNLFQDKFHFSFISRLIF